MSWFLSPVTAGRNPLWNATLPITQWPNSSASLSTNGSSVVNLQFSSPQASLTGTLNWTALVAASIPLSFLDFSGNALRSPDGSTLTRGQLPTAMTFLLLSGNQFSGGVSLAYQPPPLSQNLMLVLGDWSSNNLSGVVDVTGVNMSIVSRIDFRNNPNLYFALVPSSASTQSLLLFDAQVNVLVCSPRRLREVNGSVRLLFRSHLAYASIVMDNGTATLSVVLLGGNEGGVNATCTFRQPIWVDGITGWVNDPLPVLSAWRPCLLASNGSLPTNALVLNGSLTTQLGNTELSSMSLIGVNDDIAVFTARKRVGFCGVYPNAAGLLFSWNVTFTETTLIATSLDTTSMTATYCGSPPEDPVLLSGTTVTGYTTAVQQALATCLPPQLQGAVSLAVSVVGGEPFDLLFLNSAMTPLGSMSTAACADAPVPLISDMCFASPALDASSPAAWRIRQARPTATNTLIHTVGADFSTSTAGARPLYFFANGTLLDPTAVLVTAVLAALPLSALTSSAQLTRNADGSVVLCRGGASCVTFVPCVDLRDPWSDTLPRLPLASPLLLCGYNAEYKVFSSVSLTGGSTSSFSLEMFPTAWHTDISGWPFWLRIPANSSSRAGVGVILTMPLLTSRLPTLLAAASTLAAMNTISAVAEWSTRRNFTLSTLSVTTNASQASAYAATMNSATCNSIPTAVPHQPFCGYFAGAAIYINVTVGDSSTTVTLSARQPFWEARLVLPYQLAAMTQAPQRWIVPTSWQPGRAMDSFVNSLRTSPLGNITSFYVQDNETWVMTTVDPRTAAVRVRQLSPAFCRDVPSEPYCDPPLATNVTADTAAGDWASVAVGPPAIVGIESSMAASSSQPGQGAGVGAFAQWRGQLLPYSFGQGCVRMSSLLPQGLLITTDAEGWLDSACARCYDPITADEDANQRCQRDVNTQSRIAACFLSLQASPSLSLSITSFNVSTTCPASAALNAALRLIDPLLSLMCDPGGNVFVAPCLNATDAGDPETGGGWPGDWPPLMWLKPDRAFFGSNDSAGQVLSLAGRCSHCHYFMIPNANAVPFLVIVLGSLSSLFWLALATQVIDGRLRLIFNRIYVRFVLRLLPLGKREATQLEGPLVRRKAPEPVADVDFRNDFITLMGGSPPQPTATGGGATEGQNHDRETVASRSAPTSAWVMLDDDVNLHVDDDDDDDASDEPPSPSGGGGVGGDPNTTQELEAALLRHGVVVDDTGASTPTDGRRSNDGHPTEHHPRRPPRGGAAMPGSPLTSAHLHTATYFYKRYVTQQYTMRLMNADEPEVQRRFRSVILELPRVKIARELKQHIECRADLANCLGSALVVRKGHSQAHFSNSSSERSLAGGQTTVSSGVSDDGSDRGPPGRQGINQSNAAGSSPRATPIPGDAYEVASGRLMRAVEAFADAARFSPAVLKSQFLSLIVFRPALWYLFLRLLLSLTITLYIITVTATTWKGNLTPWKLYEVVCFRVLNSLTVQSFIITSMFRVPYEQGRWNGRKTQPQHTTGPDARSAANSAQVLSGTVGNLYDDVPASGHDAASEASVLVTARHFFADGWGNFVATMKEHVNGFTIFGALLISPPLVTHVIPGAIIYLWLSLALCGITYLTFAAARLPALKRVLKEGGKWGIVVKALGRLIVNVCFCNWTVVCFSFAHEMIYTPVSTPGIAETRPTYFGAVSRDYQSRSLRCYLESIWVLRLVYPAFESLVATGAL